MCGGGGGSSAPTEQKVTQVTIPPELMPYAKKALGTAEQLAYQQPYQTYGGQRIAGINPLQMQGFESLQQQQISPQIGQASGLAALTGQQAGQYAGYQPAAPQQFYTPPSLGTLGVEYQQVASPQLQQYSVAGPTAVQAPQLQQFQMGAPERVGAERFGLGAMQEYMSPYMQGVVEEQKRAAIQDYAKQLPGMGAAAVRAGAKGGTREALIQAEAQRGLQQQLGGIEAAGRQQAFQQAAQQFGADRAAQMQAAQLNQAAGLTAAQQNLAALLGTQQLGAQTGLQAQLANQAAQQQAAQANLQAALQTQGLGAQTGLQAQQLNQAAQLQAQQQALAQQQAANQLAMQSAGMGAQYGLAGAELGERSRQFGAGLGMQGLQQQLAAAGMLGQLGQQQFGQQQALTQAQMAGGAQLQQFEQQRLQAAYEDFLNRQRYPYQQLGFMSDLIRGTPTAGGIQSIYGSQASPLGTLAGLGGLYMAGQAR